MSHNNVSSMVSQFSNPSATLIAFTQSGEGHLLLAKYQTIRCDTSILQLFAL